MVLLGVLRLQTSLTVYLVLIMILIATIVGLAIKNYGKVLAIKPNRVGDIKSVRSTGSQISLQPLNAEAPLVAGRRGSTQSVNRSIIKAIDSARRGSTGSRSVLSLGGALERKGSTGRERTSSAGSLLERRRSGGGQVTDDIGCQEASTYRRGSAGRERRHSAGSLAERRGSGARKILDDFRGKDLGNSQRRKSIDSGEAIIKRRGSTEREKVHSVGVLAERRGSGHCRSMDDIEDRQLEKPKRRNSKEGVGKRRGSVRSKSQVSLNETENVTRLENNRKSVEPERPEPKRKRAKRLRKQKIDEAESTAQ